MAYDVEMHLRRYGTTGCKRPENNQGQTGCMKRLLQFLQRLMGKSQKISLHTPEELDCFKRDAIENRRKHY